MSLSCCRLILDRPLYGESMSRDLSRDPTKDLRTGRMIALFVPGNRPERFAKAVASGADAVIVDLEDAIGRDEKAATRAAVAAGLTGAGRFLLRINAIGTPWHEEDVALARTLPLAGVILPKCESAADLERLAVALDGLPLIALVESVRGMVEARAIACARGVARLAFGSIDYAVDLGCAHTRLALAAARAEMVLAARIAGQDGPIDGVTFDVENAELARDDAAHAAELGFAGKLCVHPRQVAAVRIGFAPAPDELAWARRVVESFADGGSAVKVDGALVDTPVRLRAERILSRAAD